MALYTNPPQLLIDAIEADNNISLAIEEYTFSAPSVIAAEPSGVNTSITLTAVGEDSAYGGSVTVNYQRLDLEDLQAQVAPTLEMDNPQTYGDVLNRLNARYGLSFVAGDISQSGPLPALTDGTGSVILTAAADSLVWIGAMVVNIVPGNYSLATLVTNPALTGIQYPSDDATKPQAAAYSYWRDFSPQAAGLETVATGTDDLQEIHDVLLGNTGDNWRLDVANRFSLKGAVVTYAGTTAGEPLSNQTQYQKVVMVQLSADCLGFAGTLMLHYNV